MTSADLIPAAVLKRKAVVYVRQSTQSQVMTNLEGQRRQYDLVEVARQWGFADVEVIDDDLGRSASGMVARPGFERLVAWLCAGKVGAVLCFEASRLARIHTDSQLHRGQFGKTAYAGWIRYTLRITLNKIVFHSEWGRPFKASRVVPIRDSAGKRRWIGGHCAVKCFLSWRQLTEARMRSVGVRLANPRPDTALASEPVLWICGFKNSMHCEIIECLLDMMCGDPLN